MIPSGDIGYASAPRDVKSSMYRSLNRKCATRRVAIRYEDVISVLSGTEVNDGLVGNGLFVTQTVKKKYAPSVEKTVNRIFGRDLERLHWAL